MLKILQPYFIAVAVSLSVFAWILPNHYIPWTTFHSDAAMAFAYVILINFIWLSSINKSSCVNGFCIALIGVSLAALLYKPLGLTHYWSQSIIVSLYLLAFVQALIAGQFVWEKMKWHSYFVFTPVLIASYISVGLQLSQWLWVSQGAGLTDIWINESSGVRPAANLNQPNQLASLILWGMISTIWLYRIRQINKMVLFLAMAYLAFGMGLTLSRSGVLSYVVCAATFIWIYKKEVEKPYVYIGLAVFAVICIAWLLHSPAQVWLHLPASVSEGIGSINREQGIRIHIWSMFASAVSEKWLFGYGPDMTLSAQFSQMDKYPEIFGQLYSNAHNIILDLMVWFGVPIVICLVGAFFRELTPLLKNSIGLKDGRVLYLLMLVVMLVHGNLELPLHHAYFLLPLGFIIGPLFSRSRVENGGGLEGQNALISNKILLILALITTACYAIVVDDYLKIEREVNYYRFRNAHILNTPTPREPDVIILDQLATQVWFNTLNLAEPISNGDVKRISNFFMSNKYCDLARNYEYILRENNHQIDANDVSNQIGLYCPKR